MSVFKSRNVHEERLTTTDEKGNRVYIYPEDVKGIFRKYRNLVYWFLISFYFVLPWFHYDGEQVVLLNLVERKFVFFGNIFWGHDAPLLIFVFLSIAFLVAFITSLFGRLWCGWACPQTVYIDAVYRKIEKLIEGKARERRLLETSPWSFEKFWKRTLKWILFLFVSSLIAHSFLGYFVGTWNLYDIVTNNPQKNWTIFVTMLVLTGLFAFDFGWFREQFCIIACPYGRFQSVLMDSNSLTITYDINRGEPRRNIGVVDKDKEGDCINCYRCVSVCPTGIDIRRGTQLECIGCTQCIDACDDIMDKLKRPRGLIRYESENGLQGKAKQSFFSIRSGIYLTALILLLIGFVYSLNRMNQLDAMLVRGSRTPYQERTLENGERIIVNHYNLELFYNQGSKVVDFSTTDPEIKLVTPIHPFTLKPQAKSVVTIFLQFNKSKLTKGSHRTFINILENNKIIKTLEVQLVGPI
jgi:cytochrome c oxidase accessory protein FixG